MPRVDEIAREMDDGTVPVEELIEDGYVGLSAGLAEFGHDSEPDEGEIEEAVRNEIRRAQEEYAEAAKKDDRLIQQVELLNRSIGRLTEELGKKPNVDEIANDMGIPQDKVIDILKLTGEDYGE
jgi:RNA polymerase primary sigma factor